ncbi:hypothetical protein DRQ05_06610 [bacterium]|nr:MAG: hypothetical protein DRQ05_06610 [bacterium]
MQFIQFHASILIMSALVLSVAGFVLSVIAVARLRTLKAPFKSMAKIYEKEGGERALVELLKGVDENRDFIKQNADGIKGLIAQFKKSYSAIGLVKYNAFEDIGGNQSYSLCLLNENNNGIILTNLVGRNSARGYALDIVDGKPSRELSDEEKEAFEKAKHLIGA